MNWGNILEFIRSLWVVWLMALFLGIVVWVMWPKRKKRLESYGRIPLDDDAPENEKTQGDGKPEGS